VARTEEILVGIVVASIVNTVLFPNRLAPMLTERTIAWFRDAADLAKETLTGNHAERLMQLIPRCEPSDDPDHATIAAFRDMRAALNVLDLQIERENVPLSVQVEIDAILGRAQRHYSTCVKSGARKSPAPDLVDTLDCAIGQAAQGAAEGLSPAALHALVLLRMSLSPGTAVAPGTRLPVAITPAME
jgi:hypothetical protein